MVLCLHPKYCTACITGEKNRVARGERASTGPRTRSRTRNRMPGWAAGARIQNQNLQSTQFNAKG